MEGGKKKFWNYFSEPEGAFMKSVMHDLSACAWAEQIISYVNNNGGITRQNMARLFELRFGHSLQPSGVTPDHEIPGEGESTIDFGFEHRGQFWRAELMRLDETEAAVSGTHTLNADDGSVWSSQLLISSSGNEGHTVEGETLKAIERICQKCENKGKPHKFPRPDGAIHVLIVDLRTFLNGQSDQFDRVHIGLGARWLKEPHQLSFSGKLISGVFSPETTLKGACEVRERVHFIGFVNEKSYEFGDMAAATEFIANPCLFPDADAMRAAADSWPFQPMKVLNNRLSRR